MSTSIAEINRIVRTSPTELKYLFKSPTEDKRRLTRLISHLVPYRVGIEFETFGAIGQHLFPEESSAPNRERVDSSGRDGTSRYVKSFKKPINVNKLICKKLGLVAFREDDHTFSLQPLNKIYVEGEYDMNEVRISISGYKQLITLYNTLQVLSRYLIIPKINGGIHIHINAPFVHEHEEGMKFAVEWFNRPAILSEVLQIFEGYTGTYNKRIASINKGSYIRVSDYPTIEFRIGRLTYDYNTIIRYIIKCSELVRRCRHDLLQGITKRKGINRGKVDIDLHGNRNTNQLDPDEGVPGVENAPGVLDDSIDNLRVAVNNIRNEYVYRIADQLVRASDSNAEYLDHSSHWSRYSVYNSPC